MSFLLSSFLSGFPLSIITYTHTLIKILELASIELCNGSGSKGQGQIFKVKLGSRSLYSMLILMIWDYTSHADEGMLYNAV